MKNKFLWPLFIIALSAFFISAITNGSQAPYGHTGSMGDGKNCVVCHVGTAQLANHISTNIPSTGYIAGQTYTITLDVVKAGINKFGFQITSENLVGVKKGDFIITNISQTKKIQDEVTHTGTGTSATNNQKIWTMDWTAPAAGTGSITFSAAVNAANSDGGVSGDQILLSSITITEDIGNSLADFESMDLFRLFPSVATNSIFIESSSLIHQIVVFNLSGKMIKSFDLINNNSFKIDVTSFESGIYFVVAKSEFGQKTLKFLKD